MSNLPLDRVLKSPLFWASLSFAFFMAGNVLVFFTRGIWPILALIPTGACFEMALLMIERHG